MHILQLMMYKTTFYYSVCVYRQNNKILNTDCACMISKIVSNSVLKVM